MLQKRKGNSSKHPPLSTQTKSEKLKQAMGRNSRGKPVVWAKSAAKLAVSGCGNICENPMNESFFGLIPDDESVKVINARTGKLEVYRSSSRYGK
jgi:hypothetical protein